MERTDRAPAALIAGGMIVGVVAISFSAILIRVADAPALSLAFWRSAGGALALAPFAVRVRRRGLVLDRLPLRALGASGLFLALHFALWIGSLSFTTVASSVTLVTASPIFVGLGAAWFLHERPGRRTWLGMALTIAGAVLIGVGDASGLPLGARALGGDAMALGGAVAVTGYLLIGRSQRRRELPNVVYASVVYGVAAIALLVVCIATGASIAGYSAETWLAIAGLIVGPQLLGHTVFNALMREVSATAVSIVVLAEPIGATLLAWLLLDELPAALFWAGGPLILVGVAVATVRGRRLASSGVRERRGKETAMADPDGARPIVVRPGEGRTLQAGPNTITYKLEGEDAEGFSLIEYETAPGFGPPPVLHRHTKEASAWYVLEGEVEITFEDGVVTAGPGTFVYVPAKTYFRWRNASDERPARWLNLFSPPGFEAFFTEVAEALEERGGASPEVIAEILPGLRAKYGDEEKPS